MNFFQHNKESGLFDLDEHMAKLIQEGSPLEKLNSIIDWELFRPALLKILVYKFESKGGRPAYDPVFMFKIIFLQKYYGLSEESTEFQIKDRLSFMRFLGIDFASSFPDKNTFWVFKERLGENGMAELFNTFDTLLREKNIMGNKGKIVDASFVDVEKPRNSREENKQIKEGVTPESWDKKPNMKRQKDVDARWTKKNNETHVGYKNHVKVDNESKIIEKYTVTPANVHDSQEMSNLTEEKDLEMWADSAYVGPEIEKDLKEKSIENHIHERGARNKPLTETQKATNKKKSSVRVRVEHIFGWQTQRQADNIRSIGVKRAKFGIGFGNLIYNMFRYSFLVTK